MGRMLYIFFTNFSGITIGYLYDKGRSEDSGLRLKIYIINNIKMIYRTKADLLGRLGKARSDVRLIDRMVGRGEVKKTSEGYELNENFFIKGVNEYDKNMIQDNTTYDKNITLPVQDSNELLDHLKFFYEMNLRRKAAMDVVIKSFRDRFTDLGWEEAEEKALGFMKFTPDPLEKEEMDYVEGLLS